MILIEDHTDANLDELAIQHYQNLIGVPNLKMGKYKNLYHADNSLIGRIEKQRFIDENDNKLERELKIKRVEFWNYLLNNESEKLKKIIISRPKELKVLIIEINGKFESNFFTNEIDENNAKVSDFGFIIQTVFNYETLYRVKEHCSNFISKFNLTYCPYCNENRIPIIKRTNHLTGEEKRMALLQLDHFYPQSRVPYLALSFFNLIPGCSTCNDQLKLEKKFEIDTHFNPFDKSFNEYFFFEAKSLDIVSSNEILIEYKNKQPHVDTQIKNFELIERYNTINKKKLSELIKTFRYNSPEVISEKIAQFPMLLKGCNIWNLLEIPEKINEINSYSLGKLKRDIAIQLDIIQE